MAARRIGKSKFDTIYVCRYFVAFIFIKTNWGIEIYIDSQFCVIFLLFLSP